MADIFREVDEELRRENFERLWKKYGTGIIALAVAVVLAVAGLQGWRAYDLSQRQAQSERYVAALAQAEAGDTAAALAALEELSESGSTGYRGLATFARARLLVESGDSEGAIAIWDRLAADTDLGPAFAEVAALLSVQHQIEGGDPAALRARLETLAAPGGSFRGTAMELMAVLALRAGDAAAASELYKSIADDPETPLSLRQRAAQMLAAVKG